MATKNSFSHSELVDLGVELNDQELAQVSGAEGPKETITFEYGGLSIRYSQL